MASMGKSPTFFEADGALRAYANRMAIAAMALALVSLMLGIDVAITRIHPPTVIRIGPDGEASVISAGAQQGSSVITAQQASQAEVPTALEKEHFIVTFLNDYMGYDEHSVAANWANALSMMTTNLKQDVLKKMNDNNTVGKIQDQHTTSEVSITAVQADQSDPLTYRVYATRKVSNLTERRETYEKLSEAYTVRLVQGVRTVGAPSGLMIADFQSQQISSDNTAPQPQ